MSARSVSFFAIAVSLLLHALLVPPAAEWLIDRKPNHDDEETAGTTEVMMPLADWILSESPLLDLPTTTKEEETADDEEDPEAKRKALLANVRTTANQESLTAPDRPNFISDRNTLAADRSSSSEGPSNMPSVDGEDDETIDVEERRYRDGPLLEESPTPVRPEPQPLQPANAQAKTPVSVPARTTEPEAKPSFSEPIPDAPGAIPIPPPNPIPESPEEIEQVTERPPTPNESLEEPSESDSLPSSESIPPSEPAPSTVNLPELDVPTFQSESRKADLAGGADREGDATFNAENTAIGRYRKQVDTAIERVWQAKMLESQQFMGWARISVQFTINRFGQPEDLKVTKAKANAILTNQTLAAIMEAEIPEMPKQVQAHLDGGNMPCFFNFRVR